MNSANATAIAIAMVDKSAIPLLRDTARGTKKEIHKTMKIDPVKIAPELSNPIMIATPSRTWKTPIPMLPATPMATV